MGSDKEDSADGDIDEDAEEEDDGEDPDKDISGEDTFVDCHVMPVAAADTSPPLAVAAEAAEGPEPLLSLFLRAEFHLFFTALGGLPLPSAFAISVHLLPNTAWYFTIFSSSSHVHASLRTSGAKWLKYLSRHCFPTRYGMCFAILDHF